MPIYAYRCATCGHAKDVLRKISDPVLTTCPACGAETFNKQVTAAGFQLKGSGWYVTDFREGAKTAAKGDPATKDEGKAKVEGADAAPPDAPKPDAAAAPAVAAPSPASAPATTSPAPPASPK